MDSVSTSGRGALRRRILAARDALSENERREKSRRIHALLWNLPAFLEAGVVGMYVHFRSEVETTGLIREALARNKTVVVPRTETASCSLDFYAITDLEEDLRPGAFGILEPDPDGARLIDPMEIDMVLLPGSVFDPSGGRLGYGGGYYDRFLADHARRATRVGLAFEAQVVERVPLLAHDQVLEYLVTEDRVVSIKNMY